MAKAVIPIVITLYPDVDYMTDLERRMEKYSIKQVDLIEALQMDQPQVSRWFNRTNAEGKRMAPSLENIQRIERALLKIRTERKKANWK